MVNNQVFIICVWFLLAAFTVQQESAEGSESGTKWMLDECAGAFMRARLRAHDVLHQMEMTADETFDQRMLFYGSTNNDRENAEFYLLVARSIDKNNVMERISTELERRNLMGVWRTRRQDEEVNILMEYQRHLLGTTELGKRRRRRRRRRLPEGRIPALDTLVNQYMSLRADAQFSVRQASALVAMMAEGLPKQWARRYISIMNAVETNGLDHLGDIYVQWSKEAERQAEALARKMQETGRPQYSYGGEGDPDGRLLVLEGFTEVEEWNAYVEGRSSWSSKDDEEQADGILHDPANEPLPTRNPRPEVEMAQNLMQMYSTWKVLLFTIGGGLGGGLAWASLRWLCMKMCDQCDEGKQIRARARAPASPTKMKRPPLSPSSKLRRTPIKRRM